MAWNNQDNSGEEKTGESQGSFVLQAVVIALHGLNHLIMGALPVLYPEILEEFDLSVVQLGLLRSASTLSTGFPQMFVGILRRWFSGRVLLGLGNIANSILTMISSLSSSFQTFISVRILAGIGSSTQHPVGTSILTTSTDQSRRGRMFGLNMAMPSLASTLAPIVAAQILILLGWRSALVILSIPSLIASIIIILFLKGREEVDAKTKSAFSFGGFLEALKNRNVLAISVVRTVMAFRFGVRAFIPLYFITVLGMSTALSSSLYSLLILGGVIGPFFWGYLSDKFTKKPLIIGILVCSSILYYSLNVVKQPVFLAPVLFFLGFMVQTAILQSILAESTKRELLDQVFGFYYTLGFTLGSVSSIILGYIIDMYGFSYGFTYIAAVTVITIIPTLFIRESEKD
jgi:sugar phosphate permease